MCFVKEKTMKYMNKIMEKISSKDRLDKLEKRNEDVSKKITI